MISGSAQRVWMPCHVVQQVAFEQLAAVALGIAEERKILGRIGAGAADSVSEPISSFSHCWNFGLVTSATEILVLS